jgi:rare lipoprotein A
MTAAHRTLPLGTRVRVTNLSNARTVEVRINDRGPFVGDRIIDLSQAAATVLGMIGPGTARVRVDVIGGAVRVDSIRGSLGFTVQVASFTQRENAEALRSRLAPRYSDVWIGEADARGSLVYRVYVGSFSTRSDAEREAQRLSRDGFSAMVVER